MRNRLIALSLTAVALALLVTACAKRPAISLVKAAPPPAPVVMPPPPPPAPAPPPAPVAPPPPVVTPPPPPPPPPAPVVVAPEPPRPVPQEFKSNDNVKPVYFGFDAEVIRPGDAKILDANAAWLKQNGNYLVLIEGHCDERGTEQYNLLLGERRAVTVMSYLRNQGIPADRMSVVSYGEEGPVCNQRNEACWAKNRRAQFKVKER